MKKIIRCEVLVVGGGSAGVAAAVAAARSGASTILVERSGGLGGMVHLALVHSICGLYHLADQPDWAFSNPGFAVEFAQRLLASGSASGPFRMGRVDLLLHEPAGFARLCSEMVAETPLLEIQYNTEVVSVRAEAIIQSVGICSQGEFKTVQPTTVVDATGDAVIVALSGAGFEMGNPWDLQRPSFIFSLKGVAPTAIDETGRMKLAHRFVVAIREGLLPSATLGAMFRGSNQTGEVFVSLDLDGPQEMPYDPTDPVCLSVLKRDGHQLATQIAAFLKETVEGFSKSFISTSPNQVGVRESRRALGRYRIETEDLLNGVRFEDEVALATWPIELRERATGGKLRFPKNGLPSGIPLRALRSKTMDNLFVAGRCLSASHEAQASLRVIGTCLATGEAAGIAAALLASRARCEASVIREIRERLSR